MTYPNTVMRGDGFYVSYNDVDTAIYGCDTTALVREEKGNPVAFLILNGDHRSDYSRIIGQGFEACLGYFHANFDQRNIRSDDEKLLQRRGRGRSDGAPAMTDDLHAPLTREELIEISDYLFAMEKLFTNWVHTAGPSIDKRQIKQWRKDRERCHHLMARCALAGTEPRKEGRKL